MFFGAFFFLFDERTEHVRDVKTIIDLLSSIGGFQAIIFSVVAPIGIYINQKLYMGLFIKELFDSYQEASYDHHHHDHGDHHHGGKCPS